MSVLAAASTSAFDQPGTLGFLVVAGMAIILTLLFRSMSKHLRKVSGNGQAGFDGQASAAGPAGSAGSAGGPDSAGAAQAQVMPEEHQPGDSR